MSDKTDWEAHVVGAKAAKESIAVVDLEWDRAVLYAADRIAELEADIELLWWDSIEAAVYKRKCAKLEAKLENNNVTLELDDTARTWIAERGYDPMMGARPMARIIQEEIKRPLAEELLFGSLEEGGHVKITVGEDGKLELIAEPVLKELAHLPE